MEKHREKMKRIKTLFIFHHCGLELETTTFRVSYTREHTTQRKTGFKLLASQHRLCFDLRDLTFIFVAMHTPENRDDDEVQF